jgi:GrpB-like predicted nucleotidyltransferase (UPF0157 family)
MNIYQFDESLVHREIRPYDPVYTEVFLQVRAYVRSHISTVEVFHIGSTAIPDLRGKPMLDIAAVTTEGDLRAAQRDFEELGFHRRDVWVDRDEKPYVCGSVKVGGKSFNVNVHICRKNDSVHKKWLLFIQLLKQRPDLRRKYEVAKDRAHSIAPSNAEAYNREKEAVIQEIDREAEQWGGDRAFE